MEKIVKLQKLVEIDGHRGCVWSLKNMNNHIIFSGVLLSDGKFFIPINGGHSGYAEYDNLALGNVRQIYEKVGATLRVVDESFKLLGVLQNGSLGTVITSNEHVMGITGIMFKPESDFTKDLVQSYPYIQIQPDFE